MTTLSTLADSVLPPLSRGKATSFGILSTYPPTLCGLATFSAALADGLTDRGADVRVVRLADGHLATSPRVIAEMVNNSDLSAMRCAEALNRSDVAIIQHEYGIYGGADGDEVLDIMGRLRIPAIVVVHTVVKSPTPHQRSVLEDVLALADQVVVMSEAASRRLRAGFSVDHRKVITIPHGAAVPGRAAEVRGHRPTILTWGLIGPGKGIERVITAMTSLKDLPRPPRYLVAGRTHPKVLAADGEAYRNSLIDLAHRIDVADAVDFDTDYRDVASLTALAQSAAVVALPYDSTDQVTSGVLVDAIASGRPVVATAFPHAVELLGSGAGMVVDHDDPAALVSALRDVLTQPQVSDAMAAEATRLAPKMAWQTVAMAYLTVAGRLLAQRQAHR